MKRFSLFFCILVVLVFSSITFGQDFFYMDLDSRTVQISTDDPSSFSYYIKNPLSEQVITKKESGEYTIGYLPDTYLPPKDQNTKPISEKGKLITFNKKGELIQSVQLGFGKFCKALSSDQTKILISYHREEGSSNCELIYFDSQDNKYQQVPINSIKEIYDIKFSRKDNKAYLLALDQDNNHIIITLNLKSLSIDSRLNLGFLPMPNISSTSTASQLFVANENRVIVLNYGGRPKSTNGIESGNLPGIVYLVDLKNERVIAKTDLFNESIVHWLPTKKQLLIASRELMGRPIRNWEDAEWWGNGRFVIIDENEIKPIETPVWLDYQYNVKTNRLFFLTCNQMGILSFDNRNIQYVDTGRNTYSIREGYFLMTSLDLARVLSDENLEFTWNLKSGKAKIINLSNGKTLGNFKGMSFTGKALKKKDGKTLISTNTEHTRYYILNPKYIQVLDNAFKEIKKINLSETPIGMYMFESSITQTIVITHQKIYQIIDDQIVPIYDFKKKNNDVYLLNDGNSINILTDQEWLLFDQESCKVQGVKVLNNKLDILAKIEIEHYNEKKMQLHPAVETD